LRLLNSDTPMAVGSVMGTLSRLDPNKANELRAKIHEMRTAAMAKAAAAQQNTTPTAPVQNAAPAN